MYKTSSEGHPESPVTFHRKKYVFLTFWDALLENFLMTVPAFTRIYLPPEKKQKQNTRFLKSDLKDYAMHRGLRVFSLNFYKHV